MALIYALGINIFNFIIRIVAFFHPKTKLFYQGRIGLLEKIAKEWTYPEASIWFHFASLGEFEQGKPVLEEIRRQYPNEKIIVTFFSPSGYEIRKNYSVADAVYYLPVDTVKNAFQFVDLIRPKLAIFTKYEFWPNYFKALATHQVPLLLISAIFRKEQAFFKSYGSFYRAVLKAVSHFFVQNQESANLLQGIGFKNVSINGDTRLDSVYQSALNPNQYPILADFVQHKDIIVAGSTWGADEQILADFMKQNSNWKLILAPHEVNDSHIKEILQQFPEALLFSQLAQLSASQIKSAQILVIDNIGMLSSLYQYGKLAYIGGGFGAGIHNTLEAAAYGIPVIFGPKYKKFQEAIDLINIGAAESIHDLASFEKSVNNLMLTNRKSAQGLYPGEAAAAYVKNNRGATLQIMEVVKQYLN